MSRDDQVVDTIARRVDTGSGQPSAAGESGENTPASISGAPADVRRPMVFGLITLLLGFGGFIAWAAYAPLDQGVPARGVVVVENSRKAVQHLSGGIVREIHVKEGDRVTEGQTLIVLDTSQARAQREIADAQYVSARATESRLLAEQARAAEISFSADLLARAKEPPVALVLSAQRQLFVARLQSQQAEIAAARESLVGLEAQLKGIEDVRRERQMQADLYRKEIDALAPMVAEGLYPRNRHQELQRQLATVLASIADDQATFARVRSQMAELRLKITQREQEYRKEIEGLLGDASRDARSAAERLAALNDELTRTEIKSPSEGVVVGLAIHTVGGVVGAGAPLMQIVPEGDSLLIEAQISPEIVKNVRAGLPAQLRFTVLDPRHTPVVEGKVVTVSADVVSDPKTGIAYFLARIEVPTEELAKLGYKEIHPGLPVDVVIITGERSMLTYLFKPMLDRLAFGLKEQ